MWEADTPKGPWKNAGGVPVQYRVNVKRAVMEPTNLRFTPSRGMEPTNLRFAPPRGDGTRYYAITSEEHSGLESRELSEVIRVSVMGGQAIGRIVAKAGQKGFWKTPPTAPEDLKVVKDETPGHYQLTWGDPNDPKIRYYNIYYSIAGEPSAEQKNRIASVPVGTTKYLDWLADPAKPGFYCITSVDRQGNESKP